MRLVGLTISGFTEDRETKEPDMQLGLKGTLTLLCKNNQTFLV